MKLTPDTLVPHLREKLLPAYLISGDEPLLAAEAADAVRAAARAAGYTEREVHAISRAGDWDDVQASAASLSLFGSRRLIELRLPSARPGVAGNAGLVRLLGTPDPDRVLLVLAPRLDRDAQGAEWVRRLEAVGAWVPVWPVEPSRLVAWLRGRCRSLGLQADDAALEVLAAHTEGHLLAAHQELAKLALLVGTGAVTVDTVRASVADSARFDVFQLADAVQDGDAARSLRMLAGLRAEGTEATLALWALTRALRSAWQTAQGGGSGAGGWQRRGAPGGRAAVPAPRLPYRALVARAVRCDRMIKGRLGGDPWDELSLLAAALCAVPVPAAPMGSAA